MCSEVRDRRSSRSAIEFPLPVAASGVVMVAVKSALSQFFDLVLRGLRASVALVISAQP